MLLNQGKLIIYLITGFQDQFCQCHILQAKLGKIINFPKSSCTQFLDENARIFHENFAEQVVILLNCPKGRKVTYHPSEGGNHWSVRLVKTR